ncbi:hypothetical protein [Streptomyces sp. NBC_01233]|uniref:hypothetical protein n=1 Tax=Streptomyces sp. NBC_01233 TaxID=2903787 RepID=UPI002E1161A7|nr:hypothetical protein OG332_47135 [Streptomyces sp. NBC_01233]
MSVRSDRRQIQTAVLDAALHRIIGVGAAVVTTWLTTAAADQTVPDTGPTSPTKKKTMSAQTPEELMEALRKQAEAQEAAEKALADTLFKLSQQPENQ